MPTSSAGNEETGLVTVTVLLETTTLPEEGTVLTLTDLTTDEVLYQYRKNILTFFRYRIRRQVDPTHCLEIAVRGDGENADLIMLIDDDEIGRVTISDTLQYLHAGDCS